MEQAMRFNSRVPCLHLRVHEMKVIAICGGVLIALLGGIYLGYVFLYESDIGLFGDKLCLKIATDDVLGNPLYGKSCPRSSYANEVEYLHGSDKVGAALFKFRPLVGKETQCPPIVVLVDRRTGEGLIR